MAVGGRPSSQSLLHACHDGDLAMVTAYVERPGTNIDGALTSEGDTPLIAACWKGQLEVVKYLVNTAKADVNCKRVDGAPAMQIAVQLGHLDILRFLVEEGAVVGKYLAFAAQLGHLPVVQFLLTQPFTNEDFSESLESAAHEGHVDTLDTLLQHGKVDLTHMLDDKHSLLRVAVHHGRLPVVKLLVEKGIVIGNSLAVAAQFDELPIVQFLRTQPDTDKLVP